MKRLLFITSIVLFTATVAIAENPAVRYFQGNKGYVKVYYNRSKGVLSIVSQTDMNAQFIAELDITVTCVHKTVTRAVTDRNGRVTAPAKHNEEQFVVCNSTYVDIPVNRTITVSDGLTNPPQDTNTDYYEQFNVVIGGNNMLVEPMDNNDMPATGTSQGNAAPVAAPTTPATSSSSASQNNTASVPFPTTSTAPSTTPIFSGDITCSVSGSSNQNIATITNPVVNSNGDYVYVYIILTKKAAEGVSVVVHVYDGNVIVGSGIAQISRYQTNDVVGIKVPKSKHTYYAKIASATCQ